MSAKSILSIDAVVPLAPWPPKSRPPHRDLLWCWPAHSWFTSRQCQNFFGNIPAPKRDGDNDGVALGAMKSPMQTAMNRHNEPNNTMNATHSSFPLAAPISGRFHPAFKHLLCLVVAILMALGATAANAAVIVGSLGDTALVTPTSAGTTNSYTLSLGGNAVQFMAAKDPQISFNYVLVRQSAGDFEVGARLVAGNFTATKLEAGEQFTTSSPVSSSASPVVLGTVLFDSSASMWLPAGNTGFSRKFLGFKMRSSAADAWKYGWIELSYAIALNGRQTVTFHSAGFDNTSGFPLPMGSTNSAAPVPTNDDFANSTLLTGTNVAVTGSSTYASKQSGEPNHTGNSGGKSVWWKWSPSQGAIVGITTAGSGFDTLLAVYVATNSTPSVANLLPLAANDDADGGLQSRLSFTALPDITYYIVVDGFSGQSGAVSLTLSVTNIPSPVVTAHPASVTVQSGQPAQFTADATSSSSGLALQWQRSVNGGASWAWLTAADGVTGATSSNLVITSTTTAMSGHRFRLMASNFGGTVYSLAATLTVNPVLAPPTITSPASATATVGAPFSYTITATGNPTSFSVYSAPAWLRLDPTNGILSGVPTASGTFSLSLSAANGGGAGAGGLTLVVSPAPVPVITSPTTASATVGSPFSFQIVANNGATNFAATGLPPGISLNPNSGLVSGTPTSGGTYVVNLAATGPGGTGFASLTLTAQAAPNQPPTITLLSVAGLRQALASLTVTVDATDPDGTTPSVQLSTNGTVLSTLSARPFVFTVPGLAAGSHSLSVQAIDGHDARSAILSTNVTVTNAPAPASTVSLRFSPPATVLPGSEFAVPVQLLSTNAVVNALSTSIGWDTTKLTFVAASNSQTGASLNVNTNQLASGRVGVLLGLPAGASIPTGTQAVVTLTFRAALSAAGTALLSYENTPIPLEVSDALANPVTVSSAGSSIMFAGMPPSILPPGAWTAFVNQSFTNQISLASNNATAFGATGLPAGIVIDPATGRLTGTPTVAGVFPLTLSAGNAAGTTSASVVLTVYPTPPTITSPLSVAGMVGQPLTYSTTAQNAPTNFLASGLPPGLSITATNGRVSGVPSTAGTYPVVITAYNSPAGFDAKVVTFTIAPPAPALQITSATAVNATNGSAFQYVITATGSPTGFQLGGSLPAGLSFNGLTGILGGTPSATGVFNLSISATNASGWDAKALTLTVLPPPNQAPTVAFSSVVGDLTAPASLTVTALGSDPDGPNPAVRFETNGVLAATISTPPYVLNLTGIGAGGLTVGVRAVDSQGAMSGLVTTNLLVTNPPAGVLQFSSPTYSVNENAGNVTVSIMRVGGSHGVVSVDCGTFDGSARDGSDYRALTTRLNWAHGDAAAKSLSVSLINDNVVESTKSFTVRLFNPAGDGISLGNPSTATVTIVDDDLPPNQPPTVTVVSISANRSAPANVGVVATGTDPDGQILRLEFLLNGVKQGESTNPPYGFTFSNLTAGAYEISVRAVDNQAATGVASSMVTITNLPLEGLTFSVGEVAGAHGATVLVPVKAYGFRDLASVQFSVRLMDPTVASLTGIEQFGIPNLAMGNFGTNSPGFVTFSWESLEQSTTVADGTTLFSLRYSLIGNPGGTSAISIGSSPTPVEIIDSGLRTITPSLTAGRLAVLQNVNIAGTIRYFSSGAPVAGTQVLLSGSTNAVAITDANGNYIFAVLAGGNYSVSAQRTNDSAPTQGLSTADILGGRRQILGITPLEGLSLLAADVDGSGTVTTLDLLLLRRLVLGVTNAFPAGQWRVLATLGIGGRPPFEAPPSMALQGLTTNAVVDFTAVKVGDANGSWTAPLLPQALPRKPAALGLPATFRATPVSVSSSNLVVAVTVEGLGEVSTAQFSMTSDPSKLRLESIASFGLPGLSHGNFNALTNLGNISLSWDDPAGAGVPTSNGMTLFTLTYQRLPSVSGSTLVGFASQPVPQEITGPNGLVSSDFVPATVSLDAPRPVITRHPSGGVLQSGSSITLSVRADGADSIAWERDGQSLGTIGPDLVLSNLTTRSQGGIYRAVVRSGSETMTSSNAVVRVLVPQRLAPPQLIGGNRVRMTFTDSGAATNTTVPDPSVFRLQVCTNLSSGVWTTLTNSVGITNGQLFVDDTVAHPGGVRVYRIIEQ